MDSFELNKIMGAVLGTLLLAVGLNIFSDVLFTPHKPAMPGYDLPQPIEGAGEAAGADQAEQAEPLPVLLAHADVGKGQSAAKKCLACHNFDKGGPNKIGPNLYGVVGRPKGAHEGFAYSGGMKGMGGKWTFDDINTFITNPKAYVKGTLMAFAGVSSPKERADIIDYLHTLSDNPEALPQPTAAEEGQKPGAPAGASQSTQVQSPTIPGQRNAPGPSPTVETPTAAPGSAAAGAPAAATPSAPPGSPAQPAK